MEGRGADEHAVGQRWTRLETMVLVNALKAREEEAHDVAAKSTVSTASDKWETVSRFCRSHGVSRSSSQCNSRWSKGLYLDYKKVRDWHKNEGVESYWKLKEKKRREQELPGSFDEEVFNVLVSFLDPDLKQIGTPESEVDSDRPSHAVSPASAVEKLATEDHQPGSSAPAANSARFTQSVPSGDDKTPASPSQKRKQASTASPETAPATAADKVDNADALKRKPIHFNVPSNLEMPRFGDRKVGEQISVPHWDGLPSLGSLEGCLLAQNEAVWNRLRILNEQVVQMVEVSNQRLLSQMLSLFTQIRLQIQVYSAQMQTKVYEATQAIQAEVQAALKVHTEQLFSQLKCPSSAGSDPLPHPAWGQQPLSTKKSPQNGNWPIDSTPIPNPPIQVDFSQILVQPIHLPREKERIVRQRTGEQCVAESLPAPPRTSNRLLPHLSDVQKAESLAGNKTRLYPHISDAERILRQHQPIPLSSPVPNWNQASFVISELDRVLGQKPLNIHMTPPAPGPMYLQATGMKIEKALVPASPSSSMGLNISHCQGPHPGHHANPRHAWSEGSLKDNV